MEPTVDIHSDGLASKFLKTTWLLDGFKQREQAYRLLGGTLWLNVGSFLPWMPIVPHTERVGLYNGFVQHE
jgi:hypothetical protein